MQNAQSHSFHFLSVKYEHFFLLTVGARKIQKIPSVLKIEKWGMGLWAQSLVVYQRMGAPLLKGRLQGAGIGVPTTSLLSRCFMMAMSRRSGYRLCGHKEWVRHVTIALGNMNSPGKKKKKLLF